MHQRIYIGFPKAVWKLPHFLVIVVLSIGFHLSPQTALSKSLSRKQVQFYMSIPEFQNLVGTIARLNQAMRLAAENPMDKFRRTAVREAFIPLPQAIVGLAQVFKKGKLHNKDLPNVQSMLGGFIDVGAGDRLAKFMKKPDESLIPKTGNDFPGGGTAVASAASYEQSASPRAATSATDVTEVGDSQSTGSDSQLAKSGELADLAQTEEVSPTKQSAKTSSGQGDSSSLTMNEQAPSKEPQKPTTSDSLFEVSETNSSETAGAANSKPQQVAAVDETSNEASGTASSGPSGARVSGALQDLVELDGVVIQAKEDNEKSKKEKEKENDGVFNLGVMKPGSDQDISITEDLEGEEHDHSDPNHVHHDGDGHDHAEDNGDSSTDVKPEGAETTENDAGEATPSSINKLFQIQAKAKYWRVPKAAIRLLVEPARASSFGESLSQIGSIIEPAMKEIGKMGKAKHEADRDKFIAAVSADAAIQQAQIQADTTEELSGHQKDIALLNTQATKEIFKSQQETSITQLGMMLNSISDESRLLADERAQIRAQEDRLARLQLAFAREQSRVAFAFKSMQLALGFAAQANAFGATSPTSRGRLRSQRVALNGQTRQTNNFIRTGGVFGAKGRIRSQRVGNRVRATSFSKGQVRLASLQGASKLRSPGSLRTVRVGRRRGNVSYPVLAGGSSRASRLRIQRVRSLKTRYLVDPNPRLIVHDAKRRRAVALRGQSKRGSGIRSITARVQGRSHGHSHGHRH